MASASANLLVAVSNGVAQIRVCGRATFMCSADFKTLVYQLRDRGCGRFVLDLTECLIMDSTFLGILAGFGLRLAEQGEGAPRITLLNPNPRIVDLLANLGAAPLFEMMQGVPPLAAADAPVAEVQPTATKVETSRAVLEAHQVLMGIHPDNVPKFKEVARFMAEDLKRLEAQAPPPTARPPSKQSPGA